MTCLASLVRISGPDLELVSLEEAKKQLRIEADFTDDDEQIERLIKAAREHVEDYTDRAFVEQRLQMKWAGFPAALTLRRPPVIAIEAVAYIDSNGVEQLVDPAGYTVNLDARQPMIVPSYGQYWPGGRVQPGAVTVTYLAGYVSSGSPTDAVLVPEQAKQAALLHLEAHYDRDPRSFALLMKACNDKLDQLRVYS